jgi:hypothetical protein
LGDRLVGRGHDHPPEEVIVEKAEEMDEHPAPPNQ